MARDKSIKDLLQEALDEHEYVKASICIHGMSIEDCICGGDPDEYDAFIANLERD